MMWQEFEHGRMESREGRGCFSCVEVQLGYLQEAMGFSQLKIN
jgi:hypothetical protein